MTCYLGLVLLVVRTVVAMPVLLVYRMLVVVEVVAARMLHPEDGAEGRVLCVRPAAPTVGWRTAA
jgi:hypothetical protein